MSSQQQLLDVTLALNSNKKKERLSALENLKCLLKQDSIVKTLHKNSKAQENTINWDIVFIRVHNAILTLVDESSAKSRQMSVKHIQTILDIIFEVVQKSIYHKCMLINSNLIASSVLAVFESDNRIRNIASAYLNVFNKYVMSHHKNWCTLKEDYWNGLKNLCKCHYNNPPHGVQGSLFLEMLIDIVKFSSKNCQISHNFLDLFTFLKDIYASYNKSRSNFENILIHLTNILCLQLAVEFRFKVCEFMENVFDCIKSFHETKKSEKKVLVYHFLMITLSIHNPNGLWADKTSYACNIRKWKSQIREIFFFCLDEIKVLLKDPNETIMEMDFLYLFVDVSYLVWVAGLENVPETYTNSKVSFDEPGPSNKRKCSSEANLGATGAKQIKLEGSLKSLLKNLNGSDSWFWLKFLELLLHKHPLSLKNEHCEYVESLYHLICDKKDLENTNTAIRCLCSLFEVENSFTKELTITNVEQLNDFWNKISTELIRSLCSESSPESHALIRSLISHSRLQDPEPLIKLYYKGSLRPGLENFKTLCTICQHCILPEVLISEKVCKSKQENCEKVRIQLLIWLFQEDKRYPCKDLAKLLIALIIKRFEEDMEPSVPEDNTLISQINCNDFCKLITRSYLIASFKNLKFVNDLKPIDNISQIRIENNTKYKLFELLIARYENRTSALKNEALDITHQINALTDGLWFCELICHLLSLFESTGDSSREDNEFLTRMLQASLSLCSTRSVQILKVTFFDLSSFSKLYRTGFHPNVQKKIREPDFTNLDFLQTVFELFKDRNPESEDSAAAPEDDGINSDSRFSQLIKNPNSILHFKNLTKTEKLVINAAEMMCEYIVIPDCSECNQYQHILAGKIVDILKHDYYFNNFSNFSLQLILRVVFNFTKHDGITSEILNDCLDLLQTFCLSRTSDFEVIIMGLQILKDFTSLVQKSLDVVTHSKFKKIIQEFRTSIVTKRSCGIKTASKFVECLAEMSKVDLDGNLHVLEKSGAECSVFEDMINLLKHPYHEIRLTAAQHVGLLFVHRTNRSESTISWQRRMIKKLFEVLSSESGSPFKKEKGCVVEYYDCMISSVSLISWAGVVCVSTFWRKKALFYLIYTAFLKKFKPGDVEDIMALIGRELKFDSVKSYISFNFFYLYYKWTKKGLSVQDFPYYLLGHETVTDFLSSHLHDITVVHAEIGQLDVISKLSSKLNKPTSILLKHCHPQLLAFILPGLNENTNCEKVKKVQKLKRFIDQEVGSKLYMQWLTRSLDKVIYNMVRNMHDTSYLQSLCEFSGNVKDDQRLGYGASQIEETLETLGTDGGKPLMAKIAVEMPWMIEKIFRRLLKNVAQAFVLEEKVFAFYKYIFFVEIVGRATHKGGIYRKINAFVIRDVVYTLASILLKNEDEILIDMACSCCGKLFDFYLTEFSSTLGQFLPTITTALTFTVRKGSKKALEVLGSLICKHYAELEPHIALLDLFPSEDVFSEINEQIEKTHVQEKNLKGTVKHFITAGKSKSCRMEGLKNLHKMLSEKKLELKEMYEELKLLRGFSEDCKNSLLHQLICMLVELTSDDNAVVCFFNFICEGFRFHGGRLYTYQVRAGAAKCLGELGPADLTTLVLRPENNFTASKSNESAIHRLLKSAFSNLSDLIISDNYEVKKASSKALYAVLSTAQGRELLRGDCKTFENVDHLTPFISKQGGNLQLNVRKEIFLGRLGETQLWRPGVHETWIVNLLEGLLQSLHGSGDVVEAFLNLIRVNWQFAETLLPVVLDFVLSLNESSINEVINQNIRAFFEEHFHHKDKCLMNVDKTSVRCILNVVDYVRMQRNHEGFYQGFDLSMNYLHVAKAALYCSAFFTSVFYAELWFEDKRAKHHHNMDINMICELFPEEGFALAEILRECHFKIGNVDGIHGCGYRHILNSASEIQHYDHSRNSALSALHYDIQLTRGNVESEIGLLQSLERFGMFYTLNNLIKTRRETPELAAIQYKCAARLLDWSQLDSTYKNKNNVTPDCFDKCYYFALKAFHDEDVATFQNETQRARKSILNELAHCSLESTKNLYLPISELQCLKELEEFALAVSRPNTSELEILFEKWDSQDSIKCSEFKLVESILTNRTVLIRDALERAEDDEMEGCLQRMLGRVYHKLTVAARKEKKYEIAVGTLSHFHNLANVPGDLKEKMEVEKARVLWERGDKEIGRFLLNHFLKKANIENELKSKSLRIYGDWMAKTKSENSREIIENYYVKSIERLTENQSRIHSFYSLAKFADSNYEQLDEYLSSPLFEIKQNLFNTQQDLASELRQELGWNQNVEKKMAYMIASRQSAIDENEIKNCKAERDSYLTVAIKYYLLSLREGEDYNLVVFRVISLWLSNCNNPEVIQQLQKLLHHIPTYKFLCLLPQLVPRMADVCLISDLIEKILQDHPHHTLPLLFALSNSYEDLKYNGSKTTVSNPRVFAAKSILGKFENDKKLERLISEMRRFCNALIELANYNPPTSHRPGSALQFADHLQIRRIAGLTSVPIPSLQIPHNKNCTYDNVIGVHDFEETYYLVGGINVPKRVTCIGTDGVGRPLLVKGKDDLRQDAVMQQVFTIMNSLLYQNAETSKRKLVIRTYKVVPLSQRSGVIEWCENTQPLSLYLTGSDGRSGAHHRFYPNDSLAFDCRMIIKKTFAKSQITNEEKLKVFLDVCKQIHPVFHYFFIEKFPAAGVWFERRLAYIHSVATSSMIGYILGIGDRHVHNILIDNTTAEVIHIDLGIAFEQGKTLPTPETVPFRLTRDIIDGMGLSGVEGDFRISCMKTMEVLRENQDTILTLLEVLLYDPLYTWTITPEKAYSIQNHTESSSATTEKSSPDLETNKMAERALIRLKQKLQGTEAGFGATNVEGQVSYLIQQARDPNNLCRLFHGWQAYL